MATSKLAAKPRIAPGRPPVFDQARCGVPPVPVRRFTVEEYHRMIEAGVFTDGDPFELVEGWIVAKMPRKPPHDIALELVDAAIRTLLPPGWRMRIQCAITTADSEPEPDLALVRGAIRRLLDRHPGPSEIGLLVEVADSSLDYDRTHKGRMYARANIPIYWIVNVVDAQVEVYTNPTGPASAPRYRKRTVYQADASVPFVIDGREVARIPVSDMLP